MYKKILVPVDGSGKSLLAARQAAGLASILGSAVTLFHVAPPLPVEHYCSSVLDEMQHQNEMLEQVKKEIESFDIPLDIDIVYDQPADAICLKARVDGYDLIVMGNRGISGIKGYLMGSVSSAVIRYAHCPVLIVR